MKMRICSICKEKHYAKGLCNRHYQQSDKHRQYQKQYQKSDKFKQYLKRKAISDFAKEVEKYEWIKDKKAMVLDGVLLDRRMKELRKANE